MTQPNLILSTLGTSLARGCEAQKALFKHPGEWDTDNADTRKLTEELKSEQKRFMHASDSVEKRYALCAELNVIERLHPDAHTTLVLFATDTAMGRICGEGLRDILMALYELPPSQVILHRIEGLQVQDAKRLRQQGIHNLLTTMMDNYLDSPAYCYSHEIVLNPLGGYKGLVPFVALLGMLYGKRSVYLFEHTNELIQLPPLPLSYDKQHFKRAEEAIAYLEEVSFIDHEDDFLHRVTGYQPYERDYFMPYIEPYDEQWTLSPLAMVMKRIEDQRDTPACLSIGAFTQWLAVRGKPREALKRLIDQSGNKTWRDSHSENWHATDLLVIRQDATAERLAGFVDNGEFYVTHVFANHDEYERNLEKVGKKVVAGYRAKREAFKPLKAWEEESEAATAQQTQERTLARAEQSRLQAELKARDDRHTALAQQLEAAHAQQASAEQAYREALAEAERAAQATADAEQARAALAAQLAEQEDTLTHSAQALARLQQVQADFAAMPRWKRLQTAWKRQ